MDVFDKIKLTFDRKDSNADIISSKSKKSKIKNIIDEILNRKRFDFGI